jgi:DhnA family fructose-bisphosphate aldolase class Ia
MPDPRSARFDRLRRQRAFEPAAIAELAAARRRRPLLPDSGQLMIVAADHPARNALGVRDAPLAMGDRYELLERLVAALDRPGVDGVLGTADVLEDLLLLGALDGKVVLASMNRGGLAGASFELDDRFTGFDVPAVLTSGFDGGKMMCRIDLADPATAATLEACGRAVTELARGGLLALVEPFLSRRVDGRVHNDLSAEAVVRSAAVAAALGGTSAYTWLKLPVVAGMEAVMAATTLPTLLLGGDPDGDPEETFGGWERALALPGVRGLVVGRTLLYPPDGDVTAAVDIAARLVHDRPAARAAAAGGGS